MYFVKSPLVWVCLMFPPDWIQVTCFWQEYLKSDTVISLHLVKCHMTSVCPIIDNIQADSLIRVVSMKLLY